MCVYLYIYYPLIDRSIDLPTYLYIYLSISSRMTASGKIVILCMACGNARLDLGDIQCLNTREIHSIVYLWLVDDNSPLIVNAYLMYGLGHSLSKYPS